MRKCKDIQTRCKKMHDGCAVETLIAENIRDMRKNPCNFDGNDV